MQCPKRKAQMKTVDAEGIEVDACGTCGGIWFDLREHDHLLKARGYLVDSLDGGHPMKGEQYNSIRDFDCPRCKAKMVKLSHHEQRHIDYEQCATCGGVYLDAGEFSDLREKTIGERLRRAFPRLMRPKEEAED